MCERVSGGIELIITSFLTGPVDEQSVSLLI